MKFERTLSHQSRPTPSLHLRGNSAADATYQRFLHAACRIADAARGLHQLARMKQQTSAADFLPDRLSLRSLRAAAEHCRGCDLYLNATQTVFGEGARDAKAILVGEVPGDQEDLQGKPFVGPAGLLLDEAIVDAGLARGDVYVTNAVKHFRWEPRGKRRLHKKPTSRQIAACRPWLEAELAVVKPLVVVCLGATAAQSLIGKEFRISQQRGEYVVTSWSQWTIATHHPSAILRAPDKQDRVRKRGELVDDLQLVAKQVAALERSGKRPATRRAARR